MLSKPLQDSGITHKVISRFEFVSEKERILHYAAADICVFPSIYEPFGIVSLEAMSMAKPLKKPTHRQSFRKTAMSKGEFLL